MVFVIDNQGVVLGFVKGACRLPAVNFAIIRLWIFMAEEEFGLQAWRVETKANVADGPTCVYYVVVNRLNAEFDELKFPSYLNDLWRQMFTSW